MARQVTKKMERQLVKDKTSAISGGAPTIYHMMLASGKQDSLEPGGPISVGPRSPLLGAFLEHLGRAIYTGVYEPGSRLVDCRDLIPTRVLAAETLTGADLKASNSFERPTLVAPRALEAPAPASTMTFKLPARSYSVVHLATS